LANVARDVQTEAVRRMTDVLQCSSQSRLTAYIVRGYAVVGYRALHGPKFLGPGWPGPTSFRPGPLTTCDISARPGVIEARPGP